MRKSVVTFMPMHLYELTYGKDRVVYCVVSEETSGGTYLLDRCVRENCSVELFFSGNLPRNITVGDYTPDALRALVGKDLSACEMEYREIKDRKKSLEALERLLLGSAATPRPAVRRKGTRRPVW